jgi:hypothetical protein
MSRVRSEAEIRSDRRIALVLFIVLVSFVITQLVIMIVAEWNASEAKNASSGSISVTHVPQPQSTSIVGIM